MVPLSEPSFTVSGNFCVTGASKGLGLELAMQLAARGADSVLLIGGSGDSPGPSDDWTTVEGCRMTYIKSDLKTTAGIDAVCAEVRSRFAEKPLHGLANVAGLAFPRGTMAETTHDLWDAMMTVNCKAPVFLMKTAAPLMADGAAIVNVSSVASHGGAPFIFAYSAAKAALNVATKTAALELRPRIRVNALAMGWTLTDNENTHQSRHNPDWLVDAETHHPMGRLLRPVDLVATIGHLLSPASVMITGAIIDLTGTRSRHAPHSMTETSEKRRSQGYF